MRLKPRSFCTAEKNNLQNEEIAFRMEENIHRVFICQRINLKNQRDLNNSYWKSNPI